MDGFAAPLFPTAEAWVMPPSVTQPVEHPQIYIWGGSLDETRMTIPRGLGEKRVRHRVSVWVQWVSDNETGNAGLFPVLLDGIRDLIRAIPLSIPITDPLTGAQSTLLDLGERILLQYGTPYALADQRYLLHTAALTFPVTELLVGA